MSKLVSVGKILNFHGIKGEVKVGFSSGKEDFIASLKKVFVFKSNEKLCLDVISVRFHKNFAIIKFKQVNSIDDVMEIKGLLIHVYENTLKSSFDEDEFLIKDLVDINVFDEVGNLVGKVVDIGDNQVSNLLEIQKTNGLKFLIPFVKEWVPVVDLDNGRIVIKFKDGIDTTIDNIGDKNEV